MLIAAGGGVHRGRTQTQTRGSSELSPEHSLQAKGTVSCVRAAVGGGASASVPTSALGSQELGVGVGMGDVAGGPCRACSITEGLPGHAQAFGFCPEGKGRLLNKGLI